MSNQFSTLTLQDKTEISNRSIQLYRCTGDIKYKDLVFQVIDTDVRKFVRSKFNNFTAYYEDILSEAFLVVNKYINSGSAFDPAKGVYIVIYLQKAIISACMRYIDKMKMVVKYDVKKRQKLVKDLHNIIQEGTKISLADAIDIYIDRNFEKLTEEEHSKMVLEISELLNATLTEKIPEDKNLEDSYHDSLADPDSDFTKDLDNIYQIQLRYHIAKILKDKGILSPLEFKTFNIFIHSRLLGRDDKKSELARMTGMTRQNYGRALGDAFNKIDSYIKKHIDNFDQ